MALWLERDVGAATQTEVGDWLSGLAGAILEERAAVLAELRRQGDRQAGRATRRLAAAVFGSGSDPHASSAAGAPTRAQAAPPTASVTGRSGTRVRRPARLLIALFMLGLASSGAWLASALHRPAAMPQTASSRPPPVEPLPGSARAPRAAATPVSAATATLTAAPAQPSAVASEPLRAPRLRALGLERAPQSKRVLEPANATKVIKNASKSRRADCRQPYDVDAMGIRRWRRECL
jgi:hypothetical protein